METVRLGREAEVLFFRAEVVQNKLRHHAEFGKRVRWDYVSDDEDDVDLIKNCSLVDLEIALIEYGISLFRLEIRRRIGPFLGGPTSETYNATLHNYIRHASGYRDINRVGEVYLPIEQLCWLCLFAEQEGDDESACRELVLGQMVSMIGPDLYSLRKVTARAAAKSRMEAMSMPRERTNRHMRCLPLKASMRAGMPTAMNWGVEPRNPTPMEPSPGTGITTPRVGSLRPTEVSQEGGLSSVPGGAGRFRHRTKRRASMMRLPKTPLRHRLLQSPKTSPRDHLLQREPLRHPCTGMNPKMDWSREGTTHENSIDGFERSC